MNSRGVEVTAPGKINLILRVLDRRPDHHHNLWSVMQTVELADSISVEEDTSSAQIHLSCEGGELPLGPENLAHRAAAAALRRIGRAGGIRIRIRKHLPVAAGMGGGSSDAAATIRALAALFDTQWSADEMATMGQEIGSDVPFFFYGPTALVEGRGERVTPLRSHGEGWVVLVNPGISIATAWAYGKLAETRAGTRAAAQTRPALLLSAGSTVDWGELVRRAENDFGSVMENVYPTLSEIRRLLLDQGAQAALLSGSGSTVFGIFPSEAAAGNAGQILHRRGWRVWVTRTCRTQDSPRSFN